MDMKHSNDFNPMFIGHGSPMNAVADNPYTQFLSSLGKSLPEPEAVIIFSAHWQSKGTKITSNPHPEQIFDFYGFPDELYHVTYRAPGSPQAASEIAQFIHKIQADDHHGIDHGSWTIVRHLFPEMKVPVLQISLDVDKTPQEHWELGKALKEFRGRFLFIGSGNGIHNLRDVSFDENEPPFPWAKESDAWLKQKIESCSNYDLIHYSQLMPNFQRSIPTNEHYLPLLYIMAMRNDNEKAVTLFEGIQNGSISMRSFVIQPLAA